MRYSGQKSQSKRRRVRRVRHIRGDATRTRKRKALDRSLALARSLKENVDEHSLPKRVWRIADEDAERRIGLHINFKRIGLDE